MPFRPVIFADGQYAIFDDMAGFKVRTYLNITFFSTLKNKNLICDFFFMSKKNEKIYKSTFKIILVSWKNIRSTCLKASK